jgi:hypothetical protein
MTSNTEEQTKFRRSFCRVIKKNQARRLRLALPHFARLLVVYRDELRDAVFGAAATFPLQNGIESFDPQTFIERLRSSTA